MPTDAQRTRLGRLLRYGVISAATVLTTQAALLGSLAAGAAAVPANLLAVIVGCVPSYIGNRCWVWELTGPHSLRREVIPFVAVAVAGLAASTGAVAAADTVTDSPAVIAAANLAAYGILWLAKFALFDALLFRRR